MGAEPPGSAIYSQPYLYYVGNNRSGYWYLAQSPTGVVRIGIPEEFRKQFAPVESSAEALAFVAALIRNTLPLYKELLQSLPPADVRFVASEVEETHVLPDGDGWKVLSVLRGGYCTLPEVERINGSYVPGYTTDYHVSRDGKISEPAKRLIFVNQTCPLI